MTETKVTGKKYRICTDATNDKWDRVSFWTKASDVELSDGRTVEEAIQSGSGGGGTSSTYMIGTLEVGYNTLVFTSEELTSDTIIAAVYANKPKVFMLDMKFDETTHALTIIFAEQTEDVTIKVEVK